MWTTEYEVILKDWKAKLFVNMWLNLKTGYYYKRINDCLTYPVIAISSFCSATIFASNFDVSDPILSTCILEPTFTKFLYNSGTVKSIFKSSVFCNVTTVVAVFINAPKLTCLNPSCPVNGALITVLSINDCV